MKTAIQIMTITLIMSQSWSASAVDKESELVNFAAVEAYMCNYQEGKSRNDLDKVITKWNKWADANSSVPYSAWVLSPVFTSVNMPADFVWLGAWQNGKDMGRSLQTWADKGGDLGVEFNKVMDCGEHSNSASLNLQPPAKGWPGKSGIVVFSNCTVAEGGSVEGAVEAHQTIAQNRFSNGSRSGMWAFFPGAGNNNPDWDYKIITNFADLAAWGVAWEQYANGKGWRAERELTAGVVSCDSPRVYQAKTVRDGGINPAPK